MKICVTTTIYTHTGGLIRLYIVIWSVLSQFKWLLLFLHHAWRGHGARLSIRTKDPNNHSDTETGTLSRFSGSMKKPALTVFSREKYDGTMALGVMEGYGNLFWKDGSHYSGQVKQLQTL